MQGVVADDSFFREQIDIGFKILYSKERDYEAEKLEN